MIAGKILEYGEKQFVAVRGGVRKGRASFEGRVFGRFIGCVVKGARFGCTDGQQLLL